MTPGGPVQRAKAAAGPQAQRAKVLGLQAQTVKAAGPQAQGLWHGLQVPGPLVRGLWAGPQALGQGRMPAGQRAKVAGRAQRAKAGQVRWVARGGLQL